MMKLAEYIADLVRPEVRRGEIRIRIRQEDRNEGINLSIRSRTTGRISTGAAVRVIAKLIENTAEAAGIPSDDFWVKCWQARKEGQEV